MTFAQLDALMDETVRSLLMAEGAAAIETAFVEATRQLHALAASSGTSISDEGLQTFLNAVTDKCSAINWQALNLCTDVRH